MTKNNCCLSLLCIVTTASLYVSLYIYIYISKHHIYYAIVVTLVFLFFCYSALCWFHIYTSCLYFRIVCDSQSCDMFALSLTWPVTLCKFNYLRVSFQCHKIISNSCKIVGNTVIFSFIIHVHALSDAPSLLAMGFRSTSLHMYKPLADLITKIR